LNNSLETVYVLGAGFTRGLTAYRRKADSKYVSPLDDDFLKRALEFEQSVSTTANGHSRTRKSRGGWLERFADALKIICEGDEEAERGVGRLEERLKSRVAKFDFLAAVSPKDAQKRKSNAKYLKSAAELIALLLTQVRCQNRKLLEDYVALIFEKDVSGNFKNRVITFNYDDVLENAALSQKLISKIDLHSLSGKPTPSSEAFGTNSDPVILNLHGSIKWRTSPDGFEALLGFRPSSEFQSVEVWQRDSTALSTWPSNELPVIIPPMPNKPIYNNGFLKYLWQIAFNNLISAEELVVIGYSFPSQDDQARQLFLNLSSKKARLKQVVLVDTNPEILKRVKELLNMPRVEFRYYASLESFYAARANNH